MKKLNKPQQGKRNRQMGADFERRVRKDLIEKGWIVSKWQNNLDCVKYDNVEGNFSGEIKCIPAKPGRFRMMQTGFPDFIAYRKDEHITKKHKITKNIKLLYEIIFVECKTNGYLSKIEKEKASWYLKNNYCSEFLIASKTKVKNRIKINYKEFKI